MNMSEWEAIEWERQRNWHHGILATATLATYYACSRALRERQTMVVYRRDTVWYVRAASQPAPEGASVWTQWDPTFGNAL